ncbi:G-protein alpha subunit [Mycena filopes]|nr:G-protein alpha subunit [Mycena filopes]
MATTTMSRVRSGSLDNDPFAAHLAPPEGETASERALRIAAAQDAEKTSRQIDEVLAQSEKLLNKKKRDVKILLLGQSESGKSTVLKNFRLRFTPQYFDSERAAWRMVVLLNLIGSLRVIVDTIRTELAAPEFSLVSDLHRQRCIELAPVLREESILTSLIAPSPNFPTSNSNFNTNGVREVTVRPGGEWKGILASSEVARESAAVVVGMRDEIEALWGDTAVRELLEKKDVGLRDGGGYFMDDVLRVTEADYVPTDSDILRARIKTMGVEEHLFEKESAPGTRGVKDFWIYDVPGSRGSRAVWIPFFDMVQAIVFLTPLSFYEVLEEDTRVNRLEDSVVLWKEICANKLLEGCQIILFFNKMDILKAKLRAGLVIKEYVPSFAERENSYAGATGYFKEKFRAYHKRTSPKQRAFFYYETTAVDTRSTAKIIGAVHEEIFRKHLHQSILI